MSAASSVSDNKVLVRRWVDEVWNKGRADLIDEFRSPDAVATGLAGSPQKGKSAFQAFYTNLRGAFPDLHIRIDDLIAEDDKVVARITARGTHSGDGLGVAPTGRAVTFNGIIIARVDNGKIAEGWNCLDQLGMLRQIGALGVEAPAEDFLVARR